MRGFAVANSEMCKNPDDNRFDANVQHRVRKETEQGDKSWYRLLGLTAYPAESLRSSLSRINARKPACSK